MLPSIPPHLATLSWYPNHLAYLASLGMKPWHNPGAVEPVCADLRAANFRRFDLREADLRSTNLSGVDLREADLRSANLAGAYLRAADLRGADLRYAGFAGACLSGARLGGANISGAHLDGAQINFAKSIVSAGPVGVEERIIYGVAHPGCVVMIKAGCSWATSQDTRGAIERRYADGTGRERHRAAYLAAVAFLEAALTTT